MTKTATDITALRAEVERLNGIEELYKAGCAAWNPVFKTILDERDALRAENERLRAAASDLIGIVEGVYGAMNHGTWRDAHERRLNDAPQWVAFHNAQHLENEA